MSTASHLAPIHSYFSQPWNRPYVWSKLRTDPLYAAVLHELRDSPLPLLDLGCGLGLLGLLLRINGNLAPVLGLDYDGSKIANAKKAVKQTSFSGLEYREHDARQGLPEHQGQICILDILQFFTPAEQTKLLGEAASKVAPGGKLIIRSGLRDASWRYRVTVLGDLFAKGCFWMKAAPTHYPTAAEFSDKLSPFGSVSIRPLYQGTPFNNYLIVLQVPSTQR